MEIKAKSLLALGEKPKDIAEKLGISYQKVLKLRREMEDEKERQLVDQVHEIKPEVVQLVVDKAKELNVPKKVVAEMERVQEGVTGLQMLDGEFHKTFVKVLQKAEEFLERSDLKPSEFVAITNSLSGAYNNIYNNSGVNVHVDNSTNVSSNAIQMMRGAMRA